MTATFQPDPDAMFLSVVLMGSGHGGVVSDPPGIDCPGTCSAYLPMGTKLGLSARPDSRSAFESWGQTCAGTSGCTISATGRYSLLFAYFRAIPTTVRLSVAVTGAGRVISDPPGIDCPGTCAMNVPGGSAISLTGRADASSTFARWSGACTASQGTCTMTATADTTVWTEFPTTTVSASCAAIPPPSVRARRTFVHAMESPNAACSSGTTDATGTLAFARSYGSADAHGSTYDFVSPAGTLLSSQYSNSEMPRLHQQTAGLFAWGDCGHLCPWSALKIASWSPSGSLEGTALLGVDPAGRSIVSAGDPAGGLLIAADLSNAPPPFTNAIFTRAAQMYAHGPAGPLLRWGPRALTTTGALLAAGVDVLGRALVISEGTARFGPGTVSAQWLDGDGTLLTDEFLLFDGWAPEPGTSLETSPLIGGGLAIARRDPAGEWFNDDYATTSQRLFTVASGATSAAVAPTWMRSLPNTKLQIIPNGSAYAVLPEGAKNVDCAQRVGIVAPDGIWCGSENYRIAPGTCDTSDATVGADGTLIQRLPVVSETSNGGTYSHSCTWHWWPGAFE